MRTKSEARRQRIIDVAAEVFRASGYEHASMAEIAERVGGSKATLYNYFPSKSALFVAVMDALASSAFEQVFTSLTAAQPLQRALSDFGRHYLRAVCSEWVMATHRMAVTEGSASEVGRLIWENGPLRGWSEVADFLRTRVQAGELPADTDCRRAAWHLKGLLEAEVWERSVLGAGPHPVWQDEAALEAQVGDAVRVWWRAYAVTPP
jgi:AcrR family transcriptional regulator